MIWQKEGNKEGSERDLGDDGSPFVWVEGEDAKHRMVLKCFETKKWRDEL